MYHSRVNRWKKTKSTEEKEFYYKGNILNTKTGYIVKLRLSYSQRPNTWHSARGLSIAIKTTNTAANAMPYVSRIDVFYEDMPAAEK